MSKLWLYLVLFCFVPMDAQFPKTRGTCSRPELKHGYARLKQRGRMVRFACYAGYDLVGDKYATCYGGKWDVPAPVCVRGGCEVPKVENAIIMPIHKNAWLNIFCLPKYNGSATLFCDGHNWNGSTPICVPDAAEEPLSCDFETPDLCGWVQDSRHDFDWTRINKKTPSAFLFTGPSYDHTFGNGKQGYYMYIESSSKSENDSARLISPVYSGDLEKNGCFSLFYHMYGRSIGGLRVYQIPESQKDQILDENDTKNQYLLFEKWGNQGDVWYRNVSYLKDVSDNFQIVIEGVRGTSFTSDIAIDDVALLTGRQCDDAFVNAVTPADIPDSCAGRCSEETTPQRGCGCSAACISDSDCCADFLDLCIFNMDSSTATTDYDDVVPVSSDRPRTEKLIAPTYITQDHCIWVNHRCYPKPSPTPKPATSTAMTKSPPKTITDKPKPVVKTTTPPTTKMTTVKTTTSPTTKMTTVRTTTGGVATPNNTTVRLTTKVVKMTNTTMTTTFRSRLDDNKAKKEDHEAKKIVKENEGSSAAAVATVVLILLVVVCVGTALVARSARGKAAIAQLRGRAFSDPEVRYLTSDHD